MIHTYVFVELHTLITDEPTALEDNTFWQSVNRPRDRKVSVLVQHSWSDVTFLSCIIRSIIHHLSSLNDYYKCLSWNMYIPTCSCTLLYFLFYLEWYHQLTSQTFTNFQSFNDQISIHVKYFQKVMKIFLHAFSMHCFLYVVDLSIVSSKNAPTVSEFLTCNKTFL